MKNLKSKILKIKDLKEKEIEVMFSLIDSHYDNVKKEKFLRDLKEKDGVVLVYDDKKIMGFTTFLLIEDFFEGKNIFAIYSGDTAVDNKYWGQLELFRGAGKVFKRYLSQGKKPLYWFLITKGIRTYLILPLIFKEFYPNFKKETPSYFKRLMDFLAYKKFGKFYIKDKGIVKIEPPADRLKKEFAFIPESKRKNPHVKFFLEKNPDYIKGTELVCIAEVKRENLRKYGIRFVFNE